MQVFISHTVADRALAGRLTEQLREAGISAWNVDDQTFPGDNVYKAVGAALESSELMVVLYTRMATESSNVRQEIQYALTSGNYRGRVIPVLVDFATFQAGADVPWLLLRLNPVYLNGPSPDFAPVIERVQELSKAGV
jgi:TIR domain